MNKGLEALEIVKEECSYTFGQTANGDRVRENLSIIEKELKDHEYWQKFVKCYGDVKLEDLQRFIHNGWVYDQHGYMEEHALNIIKNKHVDVYKLFYAKNVDEYNVEVDLYRQLKKEEFMLLKKILEGKKLTEEEDKEIKDFLLSKNGENW